MDHNAITLSGLKNTKSRSAILDVLKRSVQPISAEQVFLELKEKNITTNISTVYRTLDALADKNLATKLNITGDNRTLYELNRMMHRHYLVCLGCKKIMAIDSCPLEDYEESLAKETHYLISGHRLDIYGYCPECREKV
jgi:Fur family ferric uptake transcriptional regulator